MSELDKIEMHFELRGNNKTALLTIHHSRSWQNKVQFQYWVDFMLLLALLKYLRRTNPWAELVLAT